MTSNANENSKSSTDNEINVLVLATGLIKAEKYVKSYGAMAGRVDDALTGLEAMLDVDIGTVLTRGSPQLEIALDEQLENQVDNAYFGWLGFMNDTAETDDYGNEVVPAVRQEDEPIIDTNPDDPSEDIDWSQISDGRVQRAKAKAGAKMNHFLFDEFYDQYPDVDAVITLNCGSHRGINEIRDARGNNDWVEGQAGHVKQLIDLNVQDQILYSRHMVDGQGGLDVEDLHESQIEELREHLTNEELEQYGISPVTTTSSSAGVPASAD